MERLRVIELYRVPAINNIEFISYNHGDGLVVKLEEGNYFTTFEQAQTFLLNRIDKNIVDFELSIERARSARHSISAMKPPRKEEG